jgi:hypothetical protein
MEWRVQKCWEVNEYASRVVRMDRHNKSQLRAELLSPRYYGIESDVFPSTILKEYFKWKKELVV